MDRIKDTWRTLLLCSLLAAATLGDGVFISRDNGRSWRQLNSGFIDLNVISLSFDDSYLFAGTYGMGLWKYPLDKLISANN